MADIQRIVRPNSDWSTITTVVDLNSAPAAQMVRDSWQVTPPPRKPQLAASDRRYGGGRTVGETHENGTIAWVTLVGGTSADDALDNARDLLAALEDPRPGLYLEWRPDGATQSGYHEVRGPAAWKPNYSWAQFAGAHSLAIEVQVPVAPLVRSAPIIIGPITIDTPGIVELDEEIPGDAPALADIKLGLPIGGTLPPHPAWGLIAWSARPTAGTDPAPFGVLTNDAFPGDDGHVHGEWRDAFPSGGGSEEALVTVDLTRVPPDPFSEDIVIEVYGRFELSDTLDNPRAILTGSAALGVTRYSDEFGAIGRALPDLASGTTFWFSRLGTLRFPVEQQTALVGVTTVWDGGTDGDPIGLDYLVAVPASHRAAGPTSKPITGYPVLFPFAGTEEEPPGAPGATKAIMSDLSGRFQYGAFTGGLFPSAGHHGLGGTPIELPPGDVDLLIKMSTAVPDDPAPTGAGDYPLQEDVAVTVRVWPRWFLGRGSG